MRIGGAGHAGEPGAPAGDLYVQVAVAEDERFQREGTDLVSVVEIPATEAMLGATRHRCRRSTASARSSSTPGTQHGDEETLRGRGLPRLGGRRRGDLHVVVKVVVPIKLSDEQRELAERLDATLEPAQPRAAAAATGLFGRVRRAFG